MKEPIVLQIDAALCQVLHAHAAKRQISPEQLLERCVHKYLASLDKWKPDWTPKMNGHSQRTQP